MSFKDLTARAAVALKLKPAEAEGKSAKAEASKAIGKKPVAKTKAT